MAKCLFIGIYEAVFCLAQPHVWNNNEDDTHYTVVMVYCTNSSAITLQRDTKNK